MTGYVGAARAFNGTQQLGFAYGRATGSIVQPYTCPVGTSCPDKCEERKFTHDEADTLTDGMLALAWKQAGDEANPN